jgi:hypothetical protein
MAINTIIDDGSTEPIYLLSEPRTTGLTDIMLSIRRASDGYWLDHADHTFKASGWSTRTIAMTAIDATYAPGVYQYLFDTSLLTNAVVPDRYLVHVVNTSEVLTNLPWDDEITVGLGLSSINKYLFNNRVQEDGSVGNLTIMDDDGVTPFARFNVTDKDSLPIVNRSGSPARIVRTLP